MKKKIHPSSPPFSDHLSLLPATILTLTVALSSEDREVLAYLISCSANSNNFGQKVYFSDTTSNNFSSHHNKTKAKTKILDHSPQFECCCFGCYMSYWVRWNNSPNREIIHDIIDAYEDGLSKKKGGGFGSVNRIPNSSNGLKSKKGKRRGNYKSSTCESEEKGKLKESKVAEVSCCQGEEVGNLEKESSVKKIVSFLGGRIWGVWGI